MTRSKKTQTQTTEKAKVWLKPDQVEQLRDACYRVGPEYLQQRNEALVAYYYDTGVRVNEGVNTKVDYLREHNTKVYLPGHVQKDYPIEGDSPDPTTIRFTLDTPRLLNSYLQNRWKDSDYLFPSRQSPRMSTQSVRDTLERIAVEADVRPYFVSGGRGEPEDITPHTLRHSVAYRMLNEEEGNTMYDVRNRLRHRSIQTTERIYDHIDEV